jgi:two-component system LytT family sensor kinase
MTRVLPASLPRLARTVLLVFAGWTLYGILQTNSLYWFRQMDGAPRIAFVNLLRYILPECWIWAVYTLPVLAVARALPIHAANWKSRVPLHVLFAVLFHVAGAVTAWALHDWIRPAGPRPVMPRYLVSGLLFDGFIYAAIVASVHAAVARGQEIRLRQALLETELRMLRMQLQPHFLFNTLNAVSELIHRDPARAERALARLGDLLRWSLQSSSLKEVSLREELGALDIYLDIQRLRHGEGLSLSVDAEPAALDVAVPGLLFQPLVENAIRHGIHGAARGSVAVEARRLDGRLRVRIADDGGGLAEGFREGTGLAATRARLAGLYGADHALRLAPGPHGGTVVEVTIPARSAAPAAVPA